MLRVAMLWILGVHCCRVGWIWEVFGVKFLLGRISIIGASKDNFGWSLGIGRGRWRCWRSWIWFWVERTIRWVFNGVQRRQDWEFVWSWLNWWWFRRHLWERRRFWKMKIRDQVQWLWGWCLRSLIFGIDYKEISMRSKYKVYRKV